MSAAPRGYEEQLPSVLEISITSPSPISAIVPEHRETDEAASMSIPSVEIDGNVQGYERASIGYPSGGEELPSSPLRSIASGQSLPCRANGDAPSASHEPDGDHLTSPSNADEPNVWNTWWLEIAACAVAISSLLATFATIYSYVGKPSPDWPKWLSLNTVVSIYALLLKLSVLLVAAEGIGQLKWHWFSNTNRPLYDMVKYDDATRGPYGALMLLWRLRMEHMLASLGALIILLALVVDPFAQQVVEYYDCAIPVSDGTAKALRTNHFRQGGTAELVDASQETIDVGIQNAINAGVFRPVGLSAQCTSGNCTWDEDYSSLGWCHHCDDITDALTFSSVDYEVPWMDGTRSDSATTHTTSIPDGGLSASWTSPYTALPNWTYAIMGPAPLSVYKGDSNASGDKGTWQTDPYSVAYVDFLLSQLYDPEDEHGGPYGPLDPATSEAWNGCSAMEVKSSWKCQGRGAARCAFKPCIKTYSANVTNGTTYETLKDTSSEWATGQQSWPEGNYVNSAEVACLNVSEREVLALLGYRLGSETHWIGLNTTNATVREECLYSISSDFMYSIGLYLESLFIGTVSGPPLVRGHPTSVMSGQVSGPQLLQSLYNYGDVTFEHINRTFENISTSLTNYMRQNGQANRSAPALGALTRETTCIRVRWLWLIYPCTVLILTLMFFCILLNKTKRSKHGTQVWKSSPLPLLFHVLHDAASSKTFVHPVVYDDRDVQTTKNMSDLAKSTSVRLEVIGTSTCLMIDQPVQD